jgi:anthranilate synthase
MHDHVFHTRGDIRIRRVRAPADYSTAFDALASRLDRHVGVLLSSNYEYPGRYTRWEVGFDDPPLTIEARGRDMRFVALNPRGAILLAMLRPVLRSCDAVAEMDDRGGAIHLRVAGEGAAEVAVEEERTRAPSVFSVLRAVAAQFHSPEDGHLGLYGAFGYDLTFQFDPVAPVLPRDPAQRDLVLFLVDRLLIADHYAAAAWTHAYDFAVDAHDTAGVPGGGAERPFAAAADDPEPGDHAPGEYAALVRRAQESFACGDLFEVVPGQVFRERCRDSPAAIFARLKVLNPAPFGFLMNLGPGWGGDPEAGAEYLVGASPEMFVRVTGRRVETCPISGTIPRGADAIEDSAQILKLLQSKKDEAELTMCSDVDRNDKSRVCDPGSVRIIGRRQIEMYSRLIHTVDHIEGRLREGMDALDAFLTHTWAVTVTGAPKLWAMRFIEANEKSPRLWYGGAVGAIGFDGNMNTGLTLRTIRIADGVAEVRAGATLLVDSDPDAEEAETVLKASAMRAAIRGDVRPGGALAAFAGVGAGRRVLLVDHEDSFVHTLANYLRQTGAEVRTVRSPVPAGIWQNYAPDLVVMSPGPGRPADFDCAATLGAAEAAGTAVFGVCLGLQAMAERAGATLRRLNAPMHGKPSRIAVSHSGRLFAGLPDAITVGRYHSLHADAATLPADWRVTATTEDGIVMAIEHTTRPAAAVQFHPESLMSLGGDTGLRLIANVVANLRA